MTRPRTERQGFTLVELLVATMLLTIVMTAVYTLFYSVIQSWRSIENDHGYHRKARNALTLLQQDYDNLFVPAGYLMEGSPEELTLFVVATPIKNDDIAGPRVLRVHYRFDRRSGELAREEALVEMPLPPAANDPRAFDRGQIHIARPEQIILARDLRDVAFHYVWMPQPDGAYWREAPVPVTPMVAHRHDLQWGLPQALDIKLSYGATDEAPYVAELRLPTRATNQRREAYQLTNMLGDAL